jgi:hypothetical protein
LLSWHVFSIGRHSMAFVYRRREESPNPYVDRGGGVWMIGLSTRGTHPLNCSRPILQSQMRGQDNCRSLPSSRPAGCLRQPPRLPRDEQTRHRGAQPVGLRGEKVSCERGDKLLATSPANRALRLKPRRFGRKAIPDSSPRCRFLLKLRRTAPNECWNR